MSTHPSLTMRNGSVLRRAGFSLVELLVVISILFMLVGMIMPALSFARENARRTQCASNQRQLFLGGLNFAADHDDRLPVADRASKSLNKFTNRNANDHISWVPLGLFDYTRDHQGMQLHEFTCPNRGSEFVKFEGNNPKRARMGFYIMWGRDIAKWSHTYMPWDSPQHLFHPAPAKAIVTGDIIETGTFNPPSSSASHTHSGGTGFGPKNAAAPTIGADGGNLGFLDGSVFWRPINQMDRHDASSGGSVSGWW